MALGDKKPFGKVRTQRTTKRPAPVQQTNKAASDIKPGKPGGKLR